MLRNKLCYISFNSLFKLFLIIIFFKQLSKNRIINKFCYSKLFSCYSRQSILNPWFNMYHHVGKNLYICHFSLNYNVINCSILNNLSSFLCYNFTLRKENLTCKRIYYILSKNEVYYTACK